MTYSKLMRQMCIPRQDIFISIFSSYFSMFLLPVHFILEIKLQILFTLFSSIFFICQNYFPLELSPLLLFLFSKKNCPSILFIDFMLLRCFQIKIILIHIFRLSNIRLLQLLVQTYSLFSLLPIRTIDQSILIKSYNNASKLFLLQIFIMKCNEKILCRTALLNLDELFSVFQPSFSTVIVLKQNFFLSISHLHSLKLDIKNYFLILKIFYLSYLLTLIFITNCFLIIQRFFTSLILFLTLKCKSYFLQIQNLKLQLQFSMQNQGNFAKKIKLKTNVQYNNPQINFLISSNTSKAYANIQQKIDNSLMRKFCNYCCKVQRVQQQGYFSKQQLLKMRQKRPKIKPLYKMKPMHLSNYDIAIHDLKEIFQLIKKV